MNTKILLAALLLVSGCICFSEPKQPAVPTVSYLSSTTLEPQSTTTTLDYKTLYLKLLDMQTTTTQQPTTTTTESTTTTTLVNVSRFTGTYNRTYTNDPGPPSTTIKAPIVNVPDKWRLCDYDDDCLLLDDCCGTLGRQYAVNTANKGRCSCPGL